MTTHVASYEVYNYIFAKSGGYGAGGGGAGMCEAAATTNPDKNFITTVGNGGHGYAVVECYDPNSVVLQSEYENLISELNKASFAVNANWHYHMK